MQDYRDLLRSQLGDAFPDLAEHLSTTSTSSAAGPSSSAAADLAVATNGVSALPNGSADVTMADVR